MAQTDGLLRYFFKVNPDDYDDEQYAELVAKMWWTLEATGNVECKNGEYRFIRV